MNGELFPRPGRPRQLALDLAHRPAEGREDFFVTPANAEAVAMIDRWPDWPGPAVLLAGAKGSGKSHLSAVWCALSGAPRIAAARLDEAGLPALLAGGALAIEDIDAAGVPDTVLFHALNMARELGASLLLSAARAPAAPETALPDLVSRLRAMPLIRLGPPDDALLRAVLVKLFSDRQLNVDVTVLDYICLRMERSLAAAASLVARLDALALAEGRAISRALAAEALDE